MALTSKDLIKIEELLMTLFGKRLGRIEKNLEGAKKERGEMKDMLVAIRNELDTEHELRYQKLEETALQTKKNTKDIKVLEENLHIAT